MSEIKLMTEPISQASFRYPQEINLLRSDRALEIVWDDGHVSRYPLQALRIICQCATCTDKHNTKPKSAGPRSLPVLGSGNLFEVESLSHVGRYALGVLWQDKHDSIYPFDALSTQCLCQECVARRSTATAD